MITCRDVNRQCEMEEEVILEKAPVYTGYWEKYERGGVDFRGEIDTRFVRTGINYYKYIYKAVYKCKYCGKEEFVGGMTKDEEDKAPKFKDFIEAKKQKADYREKEKAFIAKQDAELKAFRKKNKPED